MRATTLDDTAQVQYLYCLLTLPYMRTRWHGSHEESVLWAVQTLATAAVTDSPQHSAIISTMQGYPL